MEFILLIKTNKKFVNLKNKVVSLKEYLLKTWFAYVLKNSGNAFKCLELVKLQI